MTGDTRAPTVSNEDDTAPITMCLFHPGLNELESHLLRNRTPLRVLRLKSLNDTRKIVGVLPKIRMQVHNVNGFIRTSESRLVPPFEKEIPDRFRL